MKKKQKTKNKKNKTQLHISFDQFELFLSFGTNNTTLLFPLTKFCLLDVHCQIKMIIKEKVAF